MDKVIDSLIDQVLPRYIDLSSKEYYPVIVGGYDVIKCVGVSKKAKPFLKGLFLTDIDLDYVIRVRHDESPDAFKEAVILAQESRDKLLESIIMDKNFIKVCTKNFPSYKIQVKKVKGAGEIHNVKRIQLINDIDEIVILDTSLFSSQIKEYRFSPKYKNHKDPIPYRKIKGVLFATCDYMREDTKRMLIYSYQGIASIQNRACEILVYDKNKIFFVDKTVKYILKYCALTVALQDVNILEYINIFKQVLNMYRQVKEGEYDTVITELVKLRKTTMIKNILKDRY